jgi:hypothetical protein
MHFLWTISKNNGRIILINPLRSGPNVIHRLMECQLKPTLPREVTLASFSKRGLKDTPLINFYELNDIIVPRVPKLLGKTG